MAGQRNTAIFPGVRAFWFFRQLGRAGLGSYQRTRRGFGASLLGSGNLGTPLTLQCMQVKASVSVPTTACTRVCTHMYTHICSLSTSHTDGMDFNQHMLSFRLDGTALRHISGSAGGTGFSDRKETPRNILVTIPAGFPEHIQDKSY